MQLKAHVNNGQVQNTIAGLFHFPPMERRQLAVLCNRVQSTGRFRLPFSSLASR